MVLAVNLYSWLCCEPNQVKASQIPTLWNWARGERRPGRQRTERRRRRSDERLAGGRSCTEEDIYLQPVTWISIGPRMEWLAGVRDETTSPSSYQKNPKTAALKEGTEEAREDRGFQRRCDPLRIKEHQNCLTNTLQNTRKRPPHIPDSFYAILYHTTHTRTNRSSVTFRDRFYKMQTVVI